MDLIADLSGRGLVHDHTDLDTLRAAVALVSRDRPDARIRDAQAAA